MDLGWLIQKTRRAGLLVDTNLLLLYLMGRSDRRSIGAKRLEKYTIDDFMAVELLIDSFDRLVTTPHILAEVGNLAPEKYLTRFVSDLGLFDEVFELATDIATGGDVSPLGLTDAAIARCARDGILILSDDFPLTQRLEKRGQYVLNINHLRGNLLA